MSKFLSVRLFAVAAIGVALFSVAGFANSFNLDTDNKVINAEGEALVESCTANVEIVKEDKWVNGTNDELTGGFFVGRIKFLAGEACGGKWWTLVLTDGNGKALPQGGPKVGQLDSAGQGGATFGDTAIPVQNLKDIHLLISDEAPLPQ